MVGLLTSPYAVPKALLAALLLFLAGCVGVPFDYPKAASHALPPDPDTSAGGAYQEWLVEHPGESGFIGLANGTEALGARMRLIAGAEHSIDAQYFILKNDRAGALFVTKLLNAADRGVRVRLLIDDIFSPGVDRPLSLLSSHPNVQVRLFNPLSRQGFRYWSYLFSFDRVNRRMHNKSFTVDGSMSIVGGRNIGEEYFELKQSVMFEDYEVLAIGPVVPEIGAAFDTFWNSELAVPVEAFDIKIDPADLDIWREYISKKAGESANGIYAQAVNSTLLRDIKERRIQPTAAQAVLITDSPEKLLNEVGDRELATLAAELGQRFRAAQREILIVTPYFIPQESGARTIEKILAKGIRVIIVTNSLASTNHVAVHSGYARYRKRLLQAGAEIYEIRADFIGKDTDWGHKPTQVTLHSKASVVDRETIFIGSLNFDPRSILINTEMGLFIDSVEVGGVFTQRLLDGLPRVTWKVDLDDKGKLRWTYAWDGERQVLHEEPQASWGRRFMAGLYGILPIEGQL
jgi:putative cardiolipin synthase